MSKHTAGQKIMSELRHLREVNAELLAALKSIAPCFRMAQLLMDAESRKLATEILKDAYAVIAKAEQP